MAGKIVAAYVAFTVIVCLVNIGYIECNPAIVMGYDPLETCIENCAQCKKMLGDWFEGPLCVDSCIKFKGKIIPECEDFSSISSFLNKL